MLNKKMNNTYFADFFDKCVKQIKTVAEMFDAGRLSIKMLNLANLLTSAIEFQNLQARKLEELEREVQELKQQLEGVSKATVLSKTDLDRITLSLGDK